MEGEAVTEGGDLGPARLEGHGLLIPCLRTARARKFRKAAASQPENQSEQESEM